MEPLVDIGVNLAHDSFDADRDQVIERARAAGVERLIVTGSDVPSSIRARDLAAGHPGRLFATAGIHPHHASDSSPDAIDRLAALTRDPRIVAVGECGLDFFRNFSPRDDQFDAFHEQLRIAVTVQKPVFLHQRDAHDEFADILEAYIPELAGGVAHCFTGGPQELQRYLDMGLYIGITGWICDERRGSALRTAAKSIPLERVLLETDAPYLLPRDLPDKRPSRRNEPELLPHILKSLAEHMGHEPATVADAASRNAERLFGGLSEAGFIGGASAPPE